MSLHLVPRKVRIFAATFGGIVLDVDAKQRRRPAFHGGVAGEPEIFHPASIALAIAGCAAFPQ
jgi:hypothetical protein